ncbi:MAG: hypothetical protein Q4F84_00965 [Fibrobacter sp.]|nr:hypothetical protein [Fibrobacter sp.]
MLTVSYDGDAETAEFSISNDELMITGPEGEIYVYKRYTGQIPPPEPAK